MTRKIDGNASFNYLLKFLFLYWISTIVMVLRYAEASRLSDARFLSKRDLFESEADILMESEFSPQAVPFKPDLTDYTVLDHRKKVNELSDSVIKMLGVAPHANREVYRLSTDFGEISVNRFFQGSRESLQATFVYIPGGGNVVMEPRIEEHIARHLLSGSNHQVITLYHGLAPDVRYPHQSLQVQQALRYIVNNADALGVDLKALSVGGYSAGATLAAELAIYAAQNHIAIKSQILISPTVDYAETLDYDLRDPKFIPELIQWFRSQYFGAEALVAIRQEASLLNKSILATVAPAVIVSGEYDILSEHAGAYSSKLRALGVPVENFVLPAVGHSFWWEMPEAIAMVNDRLAQLTKTDLISDKRGLWLTALSQSDSGAVDDYYQYFAVRSNKFSLRPYSRVLLLDILGCQGFAFSQALNSSYTYGKACLDGIAQSVQTGTLRERYYYLAISSAIEGDIYKTIDYLKLILAIAPNDFMAAFLNEFHCFEGGCSEAQLKAWRQLLLNDPDNAVGWASLSFALDLQGKLKLSILAAERAVALDPSDVWAQHALMHAYSSVGNLTSALQLVEKKHATWVGYSDFIHGHNWFHTLVLKLAANPDNRAELLNLYDQKIWAANDIHKAAIYRQTDAILALWYLELGGIEVGSRWVALSDNINSKSRENTFPFLSVMYIYAEARSGNLKLAKESLQIMREHGERYYERFASVKQYRKAWEKGVTLAKACTEFSKKKYDQAAALFSDVIDDLSIIGGSDEQRRVFDYTYLMSLIASKQFKKANQLLSSLTEGHEDSGWTKYLRSRINAIRPQCALIRVDPGSGESMQMTECDFE